MKPKIHLDIETYSSVDLRKSGVYPYANSPDFEILLLAYSYDDGPVKILDLAGGDAIPTQLRKDLLSNKFDKYAHNALFERVCLDAYNITIPPEQWVCTAVLASGAGLPMSLESVSKVLELGDDGKLSTGRALIRYFCIPCKPTNTNGKRTRNLREHDLEKWEEFKTYCIGDVVAEKAVCEILEDNHLSEFERQVYNLDQKINDAGILVDSILVENAVAVDAEIKEEAMGKLYKLTQLANPNSGPQLLNWVNTQEGLEYTSFDKAERKNMYDNTSNPKVRSALRLKNLLSKTSVMKYVAMVNASGQDGRIRGLLQFYGAGRTGRWAGRLVQVQNLPRNKIKTLDEARTFLRNGDLFALETIYENPSDILSQLVRTALISKEGHSLVVSDFSAIEARVLAWLAGETWRLDVFKSEADIYKASVSLMKNKPVEEVTDDERQEEGKVAELALGYQGSVGALIAMGAEKLGWSEIKMKRIVSDWRAASPNIVKFWDKVGSAAIKCVAHNTAVIVRLPFTKIVFRMEDGNMVIRLPSGRKLVYRKASITTNQWDRPSVKYLGQIPMSKAWGWIPTYGGKITENIVQAIARDLLAEALIKIDEEDIKIVMHIHDEVVVEVPTEYAEGTLEVMNNIMAEEIEWAPELPLKGEGFITEYYQKD